MNIDILDALTGSKHLADKPKQYTLISTPSGPYRNPFLESFYKGWKHYEINPMPLIIEDDFEAGISKLKRAVDRLESVIYLDSLTELDWYNHSDTAMTKFLDRRDRFKKRERLYNKRKAMRYAVSTKTKPATYSFKAFAATHRLQTKVRRRAKWHQIPRLQAKYRL